MPRRKAKSKTTGMYKSFRYTKDDDVAAWIEKQGSFSASIRDIIRYIDATYGTIDFHAFVQLVGWEAVLDGANVPSGLTRKRRSRKKTKPKVEDEKTTDDEPVKDEVDESDHDEIEDDGSDSVDTTKVDNESNDDGTKQEVENDDLVATEKAEDNSDNDDKEDVKGFDPNNLDVDSLQAKFANLASFDQEK